MYNLLDTIEYDNDLWQVERRFIPCQDRSYYNLPLIDMITLALDYDTNQHYTLIGCHADNYGCLSAESQLDRVISCLYCPMLVVCHPKMVSVNYSPVWSNVSFCGYWSSETVALWIDGILYICSQVV